MNPNPGAAILWLALVLSGACSKENKKTFDIKAEEEAIRATLNAQEIAWNNGNLEAFMEGYWKSDSLQFISSRGINRGWQSSLESYRQAYPDRAAMGTLSFEVIQLTPLPPYNYILTGRYHLTRAAGNREGVFTVVLKKVDGKWKVMYDHTS